MSATLAGQSAEILLLKIAQCSSLHEPALVQELDDKDTLQRKAARRAGRSHHIVVAPVVNSCGRIVGRVSQ